jgi:hypothetical protein
MSIGNVIRRNIAEVPQEWGSGRLDVFYRGSDNTVRHRWFAQYGSLRQLFHAWTTGPGRQRETRGEAHVDV